MSLARARSGISRKLLCTLMNIFFREDIDPPACSHPVRYDSAKGLLLMVSVCYRYTKEVGYKTKRQKRTRRDHEMIFALRKVICNRFLFSLFSVTSPAFQNAICKVAQSSLHQVYFFQMSKVMM